jgi:hypothetical protein
MIQGRQKMEKSLEFIIHPQYKESFKITQSISIGILIKFPALEARKII